jgi:hypothetical protein
MLGRKKSCVSASFKKSSAKLAEKVTQISFTNNSKAFLRVSPTHAAALGSFYTQWRLCRFIAPVACNLKLKCPILVDFKLIYQSPSTPS